MDTNVLEEHTVSVFRLQVRQDGKVVDYVKWGERGRNGACKQRIGVSNQNHGGRGPDGPMGIVDSQNVNRSRQGGNRRNKQMRSCDQLWLWGPDRGIFYSRL